MNKNYIYKYYSLKAKRDYHKRMDAIISSQLNNETDPDIKKRLSNVRSHHRRCYRKYEAMAENIFSNM